MKYDPTLIETKEVERNGKKVKIQVIPTGMSGPNVTVVPGEEVFNTEDNEEDDYTKITKDENLLKEFNEYVNEGVDPDSDEVRTIKDKIEKDHLFEEIVEEEDYEIE